MVFYPFYKQLNSAIKATCLPCLHLVLAGCFVRFSASIFAEDLCVRHYTGYISLCSPGDLQSLRENTKYVSKCFDIVQEALQDLQAFYRTIPPTEIPDPARFLPNPTYRDGSTGRAQFYSKDLKFLERVTFSDTGPRYVLMLWDATYRGEPVYVKFTETYHKHAHEILANCNPPLAPRLYFADELVGGVWMVVMEKLDYPSAEQAFPDARLPESVQEDVKKALELLHQQHLVFGDLRRPNIMVRKSESGQWRAKLLDFDFCGRDFGDEVPGDDSEPWFYDCFMNDFNVQGMTPTMPMRMSHDLSMLENAIPKTIS